MAVGLRIGPRLHGPAGKIRIGAGAGGSGATSTTLTLGITPSASPTPAGAAYSYAVLVTNTGTIAATTLSCAITLDASLSFVSASGTGWTCNAVGQVVTCTRATLATGAGPTITINVTAGNATQTATTTGACSASNAVTANATNNTSVVDPTDTVTIVDNASGAVITGADAFAYTVQYTNAGAGTIFGISVVTTLDASLAYVSSSGTGWTIGVVGQVVTATLVSLAVGAANPITINVTTGTSALTASTGVSATATNAATHTATNNVTVNLVSKDATAAIYFPASTTEWTNFIARKALGVAAPDSIWLMQEASGNFADSGAAAITLTRSGTAPTYAASVAGYARKGAQCTGSATTTFGSTQAGLPDISANSQFVCVDMLMPTSAPASTLTFIGLGTTVSSAQISTGGVLRVVSGANNALGASTITAASTVRPIGIRENHTVPSTTGFSDQDKVVPTHGGTVTGKDVRMPNVGAGCPAVTMIYGFAWYNANAEISDANYKALQQARGYTIGWS